MACLQSGQTRPANENIWNIIKLKVPQRCSLLWEASGRAGDTAYLLLQEYFSISVVFYSNLAVFCVCVCFSIYLWFFFKKWHCLNYQDQRNSNWKIIYNNKKNKINWCHIVIWSPAVYAGVYFSFYVRKWECPSSHFYI